jgi:hypothetical protein
MKEIVWNSKSSEHARIISHLVTHSASYIIKSSS